MLVINKLKSFRRTNAFEISQYILGTTKTSIKYIIQDLTLEGIALDRIITIMGLQAIKQIFILLGSESFSKPEKLLTCSEFQFSLYAVF
jgi:hypothetical protein